MKLEKKVESQNSFHHVLNDSSDHLHIKKLEQRLEQQEKMIHYLQMNWKKSPNTIIKTTELEPIEVKERLINPLVIGLTGFSLATVLLGFSKTSFWESNSDPTLAIWAGFIGGFMQIQSGLGEHKSGSLFGAWLCTFWGWYNVAAAVFGLMAYYQPADYPPLGGQNGNLVRNIWLTIICFFFLIVSLRIGLYNIVLSGFVFLGPLCDCIAPYSSSPQTWETTSGVCSIIAGYMALLAAFGIITKEYFGHPFVPSFPYPYTKENAREHLGLKQKSDITTQKIDPEGIKAGQLILNSNS